MSSSESAIKYYGQERPVPQTADELAAEIDRLRIRNIKRKVKEHFPLPHEVARGARRPLPHERLER